MPVEFIGFIGNHNSSEIIPRSGPVVDPDYIGTVAKAHEYAGFDPALLAFHADAPDPLVVGQYAASVTERLGVFIAYRPGFTAPTVLARQFATLDHLSKGRVSFNVITGGEQRELARDGNQVANKDERYARTNEFLDIVRLEWTRRDPFTYTGKYYQVENAVSLVKPYNERNIDVYVAGASDAAVEVAGRHARDAAVDPGISRMTKTIRAKMFFRKLESNALKSHDSQVNKRVKSSAERVSKACRTRAE